MAEWPEQITIGKIDHPDDLHVIPDFPGEREHEASRNCWCSPRRDAEEPCVVVHERRAEA